MYYVVIIDIQDGIRCVELYTSDKMLDEVRAQLKMLYPSFNFKLYGPFLGNELIDLDKAVA